MISKGIRALVWSMLLVAGACGLDAQSHRGVIRGRVQDASGAVVVGAAVTAVNEATNETRTTTSGDAGAFALAELAPGTWRVEIGAPGHKTHVQRVVLAVNQERRADAQLQVGALTDRVEVSAPVADVRRDSPAVGTVVENRQILDMPLDGRNFLELTLLAPGTVPAAQGSAGSVRGDFSFSVNGGREDFNSFLLDGADNIDPKLNTTGVRPPVDAIQEFEVLTSTPEAAHGRQAASQISVVMKSGTNQLQGTAYTFIRNGALDATNYFAPKGEPDPEYQRTQSGFSIGGPIVRDRTFFFADYEGTRADEGITRITTVPTDAARNALPAVADASGRPRDCGAVSEPEPFDAGGQLRGVADAARSHGSFRRAQRHRIRRRVRFDGALQLRRSAAVRAVQRSRVFVAAGLRQRRRAPRTEFRRQRDAHPVAESAERNARRLQSRLGERVSRRGQHGQSQRRAARAVGKPARRGPQPHHRLGILADRARVQQPAERHDQHHSCRRHDDLDARQSSGQGGIRQPPDSPGCVPRRAGARLAHLYRRVHRKPARRSAVGAADVHDARARRQPAAAADRVVRVVRAGQLSRPPERDALGGVALRPDVAARRRRRSRDAVRPADRTRSCPWAPAACRAPATTPIATTGRRASAPPGRSTTRRRRCCGARTASITTIRRSRRAKGCISARRTSVTPRTSRRRWAW